MKAVLTHLGNSILALTLLAVGCNRSPAPTESSPARTSTAPGHVTLFAAASLSDVLKDFKQRLSAKNDTTLDLSSGASGTLAQQIEQGAKADLFFSASTEWADSLARQDLVAKRSDGIGNSLVLVVPADSKKSIRELKDLTGADVKKIALADTKSAPAGKYAKKALETSQLWEQVRPKVVSGSDVRQTLMFVERGEADAGLVYATDAAGNEKIRVVATIDEKVTGPIRYSLVLLKRGEQNPAAVEVFNLLLDQESAVQFRKRGFQIFAEPQKQAP